MCVLHSLNGLAYFMAKQSVWSTFSVLVCAIDAMPF